MFEINGTIRVVLLLLVLSYLQACSGQVDPTRVFLENPSFHKGCSDGLVAEKDYFILNGRITISKIENGRYGTFSIHMLNRRLGINTFLDDSVTWLRWKNCTDTAIIKRDSCTCKFVEFEYVQVKCNITAIREYARGIFYMLFVTERAVNKYRSPTIQMPYVYESSECTYSHFYSVNRAARSHPDSFSALLGTALLSTAVVCLVSSTISQI